MTFDGYFLATPSAYPATGRAISGAEINDERLAAEGNTLWYATI